MRHRVASIVALATCLVAGTSASHAQSTGSVGTCPESSASDDQHSPGPEISIVEVTFSGTLHLPISEQDQIATSIRQRTSGHSLDEVTDEALARVRAGWQDRGYFTVQVSGEAKTLTSSPANQRIAIHAQVEEGMQYRLGEITFKHNKAITAMTTLRRLFPIKDGDIFSREKIAIGLENLRKAYGNLGYINFTAVPSTIVDDEMGLISLEVDADEGKQFYISSVNILGVDEGSRQEMLKDFPPGRIYNARLFGLFLEKYSSIFKFSADNPRYIERRLNEETGAVAITLDARPCPVD